MVLVTPIRPLITAWDKHTMTDNSLADAEASGIYQILNLVNGKRYIGSAVHLARRWRQHKHELKMGRHNPHLQAAWRKYGPQSFVFLIVEVVKDPSDLLWREQHFIDTMRPEYNCTLKAGSNFGVRWNDSVKARMSSASKAVWERAGHRERMSEVHKGRALSEAHRKKISESNTGRRLSIEHAAGVAARNTERNKSDAHRTRMSEFWKGRKKTPEQIEKMAATKRGRPAHNRGKPQSAEQKAKQSAAMKAKYAEPGFRERVIAATKEAMKRPEVQQKVRSGSLGRKHSEEEKAKRAESIRRAWRIKKERNRDREHERLGLQGL